MRYGSFQLDAIAEALGNIREALRGADGAGRSPRATGPAQSEPGRRIGDVLEQAPWSLAEPTLVAVEPVSPTGPVAVPVDVPAEPLPPGRHSDGSPHTATGPAGAFFTGAAWAAPRVDTHGATPAPAATAPSDGSGQRADAFFSAAAWAAPRADAPPAAQVVATPASTAADLTARRADAFFSTAAWAAPRADAPAAAQVVATPASAGSTAPTGQRADAFFSAAAWAAPRADAPAAAQVVETPASAASTAPTGQRADAFFSAAAWAAPRADVSVAPPTIEAPTAGTGRRAAEYFADAAWVAADDAPARPSMELAPPPAEFRVPDHPDLALERRPAASFTEFPWSTPDPSAIRTRPLRVTVPHRASAARAPIPTSRGDAAMAEMATRTAIRSAANARADALAVPGN